MMIRLYNIQWISNLLKPLHILWEIKKIVSSNQNGLEKCKERNLCWNYMDLDAIITETETFPKSALEWLQLTKLSQQQSLRP
jgi:hypothetical protein